jgi:TonB family protein
MRLLKSNSLIASLSLISLLALACAGNAIAFVPAFLHSQEEKAVWEKYTAKDEEFSVMMPELPGVISGQTCLDSRCREKRLENTFAAYGEGGVYSVISYQNPKHRQPFDAIINERLMRFEKDEKDEAVAFQGDVKLKGFEGKKYLINLKNTYQRTIIFYLTRDHVYEVAAVNEKSDDPARQKFFESFALGDKTGKEIGTGARLEDFTIKSKPTPATQKEIEDTQRKRGQVIPLPNAKDEQAEVVFKPSEGTHKAVIVFKPSPEYTEKARQNMVTGTVTLRMILHASGRTSNIRALDSLPYGLTDKAIAAARKIYFVPAVKDGKHVSQYVQVEYNFNIY